MKEHSDSKENEYSLQEKFLGIGKHSVRKTYYPQLQAQMAYLEEKSAALLNMLEDLEETRKNFEESEANYRSIFENTGTASIIINEDTTISLANAEWVSLSGYSKEENEGKSWTDFVVPEDLERMKEYHRLRRINEFLAPRKYEFRFIRRNGEIRNMICSVTIIPGTKKSIASMIDITERKRAEEALSESEERFRRLAENARDVIYRMSLPDGKYEYISPATLSIFGYSHEEFYKTPLLFNHTIHPEWHKYFEEQWVNLIKGEMPPTYEYQIIHKSGEVRWMNQRNILVRDDAGKPIAIEGIVTDITERKNAEEAVHESETRFRAILENSQVALYKRDYVTNTYEYMSPVIVRITGYTSEELKALSVEEVNALIHQDDLKNIQNVLSLAIANGGGQVQFEYRFKHKNGEIKWVSDVGEMTLDSKGNPFYCIGSVQDITERKHAEEALKLSEKKYRLLFESAPLGIFLINRKGEILNLNSAGQHILGSPSIEATKAINILTFPLLVKIGFSEKVKECFENGEGNVFEFLYTSKWGKTVYLRCYLTPIINANNEVDNVQLLLEDFTEIKKAEEELQKNHDQLEDLVQQRTEELRAAQDELVRNERLATLGQLTAIVSHELRNPLGTIRNSIYEMNERLRGKNSGLEKALDRAERNIIRCDTIIEELLDYTREREHTTERLLIDEWVGGFLDEITIPEKIKLVRKLNANVEVNINPESFRRCLINLIDNAVQAMTETEKEIKSKNQSSFSNVLSIETRIEEDNLIINIKDNGQGMSKDELKEIFEPLYSTKGFGVGLGLPIVKKIVEQHKGNIEIKSKIGEGTTAMIQLPVSNDK